MKYKEAKILKINMYVHIDSNMIHIMKNVYRCYNPLMDQYINKIGKIITIEDNINYIYFNILFHDNKTYWFTNECISMISNLYEPRIKKIQENIDTEHNYILNNYNKLKEKRFLITLNDNKKIIGYKSEYSKNYITIVYPEYDTIYINNLEEKNVKLIQFAPEFKIGEKVLLDINLIIKNDEIYDVEFFTNTITDLLKLKNKIGKIISYKEDISKAFYINVIMDDLEFSSNELELIKLSELANTMYKPRKINDNIIYNFKNFIFNESPNNLKYNNYILSYTDNDAIPFGIDSSTNRLHIGEYGSQHFLMYPLQHQRKLTKNEGRLWINSKVISFYTPYPNINFLQKYLDRIESAVNKKFNIKLNFKTTKWVIDFIDLKKEYQKNNLNYDINNIPDFVNLKDYNYYYDIIKNIKLKKIPHIESPLNKEKNVPYGYGSKNPKYKSLAYRQALYVERFSNYNKKRD